MCLMPLSCGFKKLVKVVNFMLCIFCPSLKKHACMEWKEGIWITMWNKVRCYIGFLRNCRNYGWQGESQEPAWSLDLRFHWSRTRGCRGGTALSGAEPRLQGPAQSSDRNTLAASPSMLTPSSHSLNRCRRWDWLPDKDLTEDVLIV